MAIVTLNWNNSQIAATNSLTEIGKFSIPQGYVNATQMCQVNGKQFKHWNETKRAKAFVQALSRSIGISTDLSIIQITQSGNQGTWVHPRIAMNIGQWISPEFDLWISDQVFTLLSFQEIAQGLLQSFEQTKARKEVEESFIYAFGTAQSEEYLLKGILCLKIGSTTDVIRRYKQINAFTPYPLFIIDVRYGTLSEELEFHKKPESIFHCIKGEWYMNGVWESFKESFEHRKSLINNPEFTEYRTYDEFSSNRLLYGEITEEVNSCVDPFGTYYA